MDLNAYKDTPPWELPAREVKEALRNPGRADRLLAVEMAGQLTVMDDEVAEMLLAILGDSTESDQIRARAAIALGPALEDADTSEFDDEYAAPAITEQVFVRIRERLRAVYNDQNAPKQVRRRALEAAVRAPDDWHQDALRKAWASGDAEWKLTAVFGMRWVPGDFNKPVLDALTSRDSVLRREGVLAAGQRELDAAWPHIAKLVLSKDTEKPLLLAAIDAAAAIRPDEAPELLSGLAGSEDEDIADAVEEALMMASRSGEDEDDED